ncbi:MAG: SET domain-containing protein-lysine N-methyltransferase [Anaerolineae bacterium]|nr:SET domain-containing protein-lysine N-methyltransferase [Anaerolineae bacterium]
MYSHLSPKLVVKSRKFAGDKGVYATENIKVGELLALWGGRVVHTDQFNTYPERTRQLSVQIEDEYYLVPIKPGEPADFVNHCCAPNAGMSGQIGVVAMRDIQPGEEICIDYAMCDSSPYDEFTCVCGVPECRGKITGKDWQLAELQERYREYFSPYLQQKIAMGIKNHTTMAKIPEVLEAK